MTMREAAAARQANQHTYIYYYTNTTMKTSHTIGNKDLADLLVISSTIGDDHWLIADWILDVIGVPPESDHDFNALTKEELDRGFDNEGFVTCCRDAWHAMHTGRELDRKDAMAIIASWLDAESRANTGESKH